MKKLKLLFVLALAAFFANVATAQMNTARVQVVHNSADAAAGTVDVWLNNTLLLDDFQFRTATPFVNAPAGMPIDLVVQPSSSTDTTNALFRKTVTLTANDTYIVVANGIVSTSGYMPATPFDLYVFGMGREQSNTAGETDVLVFHGATDAPTVDVKEVSVPAGTIVNDISYGDFQGYLELANADYSLQVRTADGGTTVEQYGAPLQTLGWADTATVVVASGFLNPSNNQNGPAFGLFAVRPDGGALIPLPTEAITTARVKVIHNCADGAAATVDVWLNDGMLLDDFEFRVYRVSRDATDMSFSKYHKE